MKLLDGVSTIKNIGEKRLQMFNRLDVFTIKDLLEYYPKHYEDRSKLSNIEDLVIGQNNSFSVIIKTEAENIKIKNLIMTKLKINKDLEIIFFGRPYLKKVFTKSKKFMFYGEIKENFGKLKMENPDYEEINEKELLHTGRIVPIYPLTKGLSQKVLRSIIKSAVDSFDDKFKNFIPEFIISKNNLCNKNFAVKNIHFPNSDDDFFSARKRLVFEELFLIQYGLFKIKGNIKNKKTGIVFDKIDIQPVLSNIPFEMTTAQEKVIGEMISDFKSGYVMNRLLQGDVGSGKTLIGILACYIAIKNGFQSCILAPTEVLAMQHFETFKKIFNLLEIKTVFLTGSQKKKEKDLALLEIENGKAEMIVGTHALIQDKVKFFNLGFAITDEQHRFGVKQREALSKKGEAPHTLVMTATPIPRTLALILYGDLDISILDKLPPNRQKVDTFFVSSNYKERYLKFIKNEVSKGNQCYVVCSMIEESENSDLKSVLVYTEKLKESLTDINIEAIHGKMKQENKNTIMEKFTKNEISVIVSTTVIEVGINVPNASLMIIENAERFGLSQLHQLRGRVGRGTEKSYCILVSDTKNKQTKERLNAMVKSNDGFYISELDLKLRGQGDFFGTRQHGLPEFKIANLYSDIDILKDVQKSITTYLKNISVEEKNILDNEVEKYLFRGLENVSL